MDIQNFLRLKSLFGQPMAQPGIDTYSGSMPPIEPMGSGNELDTYQPRTAISSQLTSELGNMPIRPQPGMMRRIGASLAGFGAGANAQGIDHGQPIGFKFNPAAADLASDKVKYGDFDNQLSDWQNKVKSLSLGATEEDRANAGEITRLKNEAANDINQQKVGVAQQRADAYDKSMEVKELAEQNKHETAMAKIKANIEKADAQLALAKQKHEVNKKNTEFMQEFHNAELAARAAREEFHQKDAEFRNEQLQRRVDSTVERNKILNQSSSGSGKETTSSYEYDDQGRPKRKKVISGPAQGRVRMLTKDGDEVDIPENKVDDFIKNYGGKRK